MKLAVSNAGVSIPYMIYGTAWKKEKTANLVFEAIVKGYRGVDTACQPRHYNEPLVGEGIQRAIDEGVCSREDLFVQTKFTSPNGQDPASIPYDPALPITQQVLTSFQVSLKNLGQVESLVLHSPYSRFSDTMEAWRAMETLVENKQVRQLGVSNIYCLDTLKNLYSQSNVKPAVVQNRFYSDTKYDIGVRAFCAEHKILYQSFWTLSANPSWLQDPYVLNLAKNYKCKPAQIIFSWLTYCGVTPLNGTTNPAHMVEGVEVAQGNYILTPEELEFLSKHLVKDVSMFKYNLF